MLSCIGTVLSKCRICLLVLDFPELYFHRSEAVELEGGERMSSLLWISFSSIIAGLSRGFLILISKLFFMTYVGLSSPACMAAVLACSSVLPRTTLFGEKSYGDTWGSQTWTTCIVPIVFSRLLFKSPPDLKGVNIFQFVMIHFFWITLPTRLWLRRWTSLQCQQRQQGTWGSAPTDKQVIS